MPGTSRSPVTPPRNRRSRKIRVVAAALVFSAIAATGPIAVAQNKTPDELREERKQAQEDAAENQTVIDELIGDLDRLELAFKTLEEARDSAQQAVDAAIRKLDEALVVQAKTEERIAELEAEVAETEKLLEESAVSAFRSHQGPNSEQTALSSDPWQYARSEALRRFANRSTEDLLDDFRGQAAELEALRADALRYITEVEELRNESLERQDKFDTALAREDQALETIYSRLDHLLGEAEYLKDLDAQLAGEINREVERLAAIAAAAKRRVQGVTVPPNAPVELASVWGIVVNVLIVDELEGLLVAMEAEGFILGGGGYRDNSRQIELRRQHCGTSEYAVYQMPASQCRPPTARPGFSQHEVGLAVDFIHNGRIISSRNTAVFQALTRIAPDYGFKNLPSEPWHWSTTGR